MDPGLRRDDDFEAKISSNIIPAQAGIQRRWSRINPGPRRERVWNSDRMRSAHAAVITCR
jgi:hypothetical protein